MLSVQVLTMIALWCGTPINQTKGGLGFKSGINVKMIQVKSCRKKMIKCAVKHQSRYDKAPYDNFNLYCLDGPFN